MKITESLDLKTFPFPNLTKAERAFSTLDTDKRLLKEAESRGFYCGNTPYNKLFSNLFFVGGKIKFKSDIDPEFKQITWDYCRAFMGSWSPKHEEKEAICAMLMSELLEPELDKS